MVWYLVMKKPLKVSKRKKWKVYQVGEPGDVVKNTIEQRKKEKMEEKDKKAELNSEILKNYQKKEAKSIKKIFITLFLLGVFGYVVNFLMGG